MQSNFDKAFSSTMKEEGGYVNNKNDPGGMTNLGVTKKSWEEYVGHEVTESDMRALTKDIVKPFYKKRYWDACKCSDLHGGVDLVVFDIAVNSGTGRAAKFLQEAVGVTPDGSIGPRTLSAEANFGANLIINKICDRREAFYRSLPTFPTFGKGWLARCERVRQEAISMVS